MTAQERERFAVMISGIAETLGQEMTPARISGLLAALDDVPWRHLESALRVAHRTCRFVPSPGELRELAAEAAQVRGTYKALPSAEKANVRSSWAGTEDEARRLREALPKPPSWPERPGFADWFAAVNQRMHDMHAGGPTHEGAHENSEGRQGAVSAQEAAPVQPDLRR